MQVLLKVLKYSLIVIGILLFILLIFGIVLALDWPLWMGVFILIGLLGLGVGFLFLRKIWLRRREQQFVHQIVEQDNSSFERLAKEERVHSKEIQGKWKEAVEALKRSHLKKFGNPLYVLPWYLVIGESGSGKTTALQSARLSSPFAEVNRTSGISGTRNCDWWFFEQAIIIDTAGRFAIPIDEDRDKDEWQKFLTLLSKYRKREPLNGLIVSISADQLLETGLEALEEKGQIIRRRLDELMRALEVKVPVYILVTKCDLIQGMTQFCDRLPDQTLDQAMGFMNHDLLKDVSTFQERVFNTIGDRLRDLRLLLIHQPKSTGVDPALLLFPEEFERVKAGLTGFMKKLFQENPYQETPIMRGLFFSSGRQEGSPYSHFLQALGMITEKEVLPGTNKGLFLHDFFSRILPKERHLFAPTQRAIEWKRLTRSLGLTSWIAIMVALCGLLSFSFVMNMKTLREVSHEFSKPPILQGEMVPDLMIMDQFHRAILKVEDLNQNWWIPTLGLHESKEVETGLKEKYCRQFQKGFLDSYDERMAGKMAYTSASISDTFIRQYVFHLVRRINLIKARLEGQDFDSLQTKSQPSYEAIKGQEMIPDIKDTFDGLYLYYLIWNKDSAAINKKMNTLQQWLKYILTMKGTNLHWLVEWINEDLSPITLEDFWGGAVSRRRGETTPDSASVAPAFTIKGKERIDSFFMEIESALADPLIISSQRLEFNEWYSLSYRKAWYAFGIKFPEGVKRITGREDQRQMAVKMASGEGPYMKFLDAMAREMEFFLEEKDISPWIELIFQFQAIQEQAANEAAAREGKGIMDKVAHRGKKLVHKMGRTLAKIDNIRFTFPLTAAHAYLDYENALSEISSALPSENLAYQTASQIYSEEPVTSKAPFYNAYRAMTTLKASIAEKKPVDEMFWNLVTGPFDYLWSFVRSETSCYLQEQWEKEILAEIQGISGWKKIQQLVLGNEGYVWEFVKTIAEPFVSRKYGKGYYAKKVFGGRIPFDDSFFTFINKGAKATVTVEDSYTVKVKALPTDANPGARLKPHATRLEIHCSDGVQRLINLNYPKSEIFTWSPENCSKVIFQIEVSNVVLTKEYQGYQAFAKFLEDFRGGERILYPGEFPEEKVILERYGIRYMKARYQFSGHKPILALLKNVPIRVPQKITRCRE